MKNAAWCLVALGMVAGCGSNARPATDGGVTTPDTGTTPGNDAGSQTPDTGGGGGTCGSIASATAAWPALPSGCVPRCAMATALAYNTCAQTFMMNHDQAAFQSCKAAAFAADTTPTASVDLGGGDTLSVSCAGNSTNALSCEQWQLQAAISMSCDSQLGMDLQCEAQAQAGGMDPQTVCATQITAVNDCITANMAAIQTAANGLFTMCFSQT
ncbi:MAG: hypothetical protein U0234_01845 [Sandaracinus sp.]